MRPWIGRRREFGAYIPVPRRISPPAPPTACSLVRFSETGAFDVPEHGLLLNDPPYSFEDSFIISI